MSFVSERYYLHKLKEPLFYAVKEVSLGQITIFPAIIHSPSSCPLNKTYSLLLSYVNLSFLGPPILETAVSYLHPYFCYSSP